MDLKHLQKALRGVHIKVWQVTTQVKKALRTYILRKGLGKNKKESVLVNLVFKAIFNPLL